MEGDAYGSETSETMSDTEIKGKEKTGRLGQILTAKERANLFRAGLVHDSVDLFCLDYSGSVVWRPCEADGLACSGPRCFVVATTAAAQPRVPHDRCDVRRKKI